MSETTTDTARAAIGEALEKGARTLADGAPGAPAGGGYDVEAINEIYAVVQLGASTLVLQENFKTIADEHIARLPPADRVRFMTLDSFRAWFLNRLIPGEDGKPIKVANIWLSDTTRRQYSGVVFDPSTEPGEAAFGYYNLWRGFAVEPDPDGDCSLFLDHVRTNLANGREDDFDYIMGWAAQMVQRPAEKPGISLVLRGGMGSGKTVFGQVIGRLFGPHYVLVDDPHYVTGNFNAHMAACLLLQADEGFWAGDPGAAGRLKGLVTSAHQMIEPKGKDAVQMANHVRLLVTSNSDWVVPAGPDERRFAVFDVGSASAQNREYFGAMFDQLERGGGYGALLDYLLRFDLGTVDLNRLPQTAALLDQKIASLHPPEKWWFECLRRGFIRTPDSNVTDVEWPEILPTAQVSASYFAWSDKMGVRFKQSETQIGRMLSRLAPGIRRGRRRDPEHGGQREYVYRVPDLAACRAAFEDWIRADGGLDWEEGEIELPKARGIDFDKLGNRPRSVPTSQDGVDDL